MPIPLGAVALGAGAAALYPNPPGRAHFVPIDAAEADLGRHGPRRSRRLEGLVDGDRPVDPATERFYSDVD